MYVRSRVDLVDGIGQAGGDVAAVAAVIQHQAGGLVIARRYASQELEPALDVSALGFVLKRGNEV